MPMFEFQILSDAEKEAQRFMTAVQMLETYRRLEHEETE